MSLELQPLEESDIPEYISVVQDAFAGSLVGILVTPSGGNTPARTQVFVEREQKAFLDENTHYRKVVDTDTGKIVAAVKWKLYPKGRTQAVIDEQYGEIPAPQPDSNVKAEKDFFTYLNESRHGYMGTKPFSFLQSMTTLPEYQGKGAGKTMMEWGIEETDKLGLPAYVEATEAGLPVYARFGFKTEKTVVFDLNDYGLGNQTAANTIMLRDARPPTH